MGKPLSFEEIALMLPYLSSYEKEEILKYYANIGVYCVSSNITSINENESFEDADGYYRVSLYDHIKYRYEVLNIIGRGTFGLVVHAYDHLTDLVVAIKISRSNNSNELIQEAHNLEMLQKRCKNQKHILQIYEYFSFRNHVFLVEEILYNSLNNELEAYPMGFPVDKVRDVIYFTLKGLCCLSEIGLVHADLKPSNIALKNIHSNDVKIIDYGASHLVQKYRVAQYMQALPYRAPEVILQLFYGSALDMWSIGCVTAELMLGYPLFLGFNEADQLASIIEVLGLPPSDILCTSSAAYKFFNHNRDSDKWTYKCPQHRQPPGSRDLKAVFEQFESPNAIDFMMKCFTWDSKIRITPSQALKHRWFKRHLVGLEEGFMIIIACVTILIIIYF